MSELSELIRINKNIERQNREIVRLLKIIAGESDFVDRSGYVFPEFPEEEEIYEDAKNFTSLLEVTCDVGEVYFIEGGDIFKLSIENNETSLDNLTGDGEPSAFNLQELIANESINNNASLQDGTVILSMEQSQNLPETLKICVEQGAQKVYMPLFASAQLVGAPQSIMELVKLDFYKNNENLIEKLFK